MGKGRLSVERMESVRQTPIGKAGSAALGTYRGANVRKNGRPLGESDPKVSKGKTVRGTLIWGWLHWEVG